MAKLGQIASDSKKESQGVWRTYPGTDIQCRIARLGNPDYELEAKRMRRDKRAYKVSDGTLTEREAKNAIAPAVARYILLEWKNIEQDGSTPETPLPLAYSYDAALKLLMDPEQHDFYDWVMKCAQDSGAYQRDLEVEAKGN